ncbi:MAG: HAMP domain-containing histidine kinase [Verrucomicrobiales bacterium]|nr:HAMP domain-containing histidine kinase [Verrucomicrobiales bacterium]
MQFVFPTQIEISNTSGEGFYPELLRGLTHKLNNLLAVIQGFSSLVLMQDDLDPSVAENMQHIREASEGVSTLSERIRSAGGCAKVSLQNLQLNDYFGVVGNGLAEPFRKAGVPFEMDVQPGLPPIQVDPGRFKEVLLELLRNAADAARAGEGRAMLKVCGPGVITPENERRVDLLISNTGSQIPAEKLQEVFRPFHGSKSSHHLGLGLTIASMLAAQMRLQLGVASENQTTTFWISCPAA